jgi:hypothetical protein
LSSEGGFLIFLEVVHISFILDVGLSLVESGELSQADALLFLLLLFS